MLSWPVVTCSRAEHVCWFFGYVINESKKSNILLGSETALSSMCSHASPRRNLSVSLLPMMLKVQGLYRAPQ